ncbi:MAG TPA: hypothetical protein VJH03_20110 [Blastocatellia bacterium]|nr:hypothetical protein [Blastocatellia bacterium]
MLQRCEITDIQRVRRDQNTPRGLALIRSLALNHKGRIWIEGEMGKPSNFICLLSAVEGRKSHTNSSTITSDCLRA